MLPCSRSVCHQRSPSRCPRARKFPASAPHDRCMTPHTGTFTAPELRNQIALCPCTRQIKLIESSQLVHTLCRARSAPLRAVHARTGALRLCSARDAHCLTRADGDCASVASSGMAMPVAMMRRCAASSLPRLPSAHDACTWASEPNPAARPMAQCNLPRLGRGVSLWIRRRVHQPEWARRDTHRVALFGLTGN